MEQVVQYVEDIDSLKQLLTTEDILSHMARAQLVFIQIVSSNKEKKWLKSLVKEVEKAFPSAVIKGVSTEEESFKGLALKEKTIIAFSFFNAASVVTEQTVHHSGAGRDGARLMELVEAVSTELERANEEIARFSVYDKLTQVYNRSKTDYCLKKELSRSERYGSTFSVILIDIDLFKIVNDVYGHAVGDIILVEVARGIKGIISRSSDLIGSWGGDEFMAILPETNNVQAQLVAERLCVFIANREFSGGLKLTCSLGVTSYGLGDSEDSMLVRADRALYEAKMDGRNQVVAKMPE